MSDGFGGLKFAQLIFGLNWAESFLAYYNAMAKPQATSDNNSLIEKPELIFDESKFYIVDVNDNKLDYNVHMYIEKYIKDDIIYDKQI